MPEDNATGLGRFLSTRWSLIENAQHDASTVRRPALDELLRIYLPALRAHLVLTKRIDTDRANDLLQGFVTDKILERDLIAQADPAKGRFRSLLLRSLENYIVDQVRRQKAQKRSAGAVLSIDQEGVAQVAAADVEGAVYDVVWAKRTFLEVLSQMTRQCEARDTLHTWNVFECRIVEPLLRGTSPVSYDELVRRFGFDSPKQATNALATAKRQFDEALHAVVGQYVANKEELEEEIAYLRAALLNAGPISMRAVAAEAPVESSACSSSPDADSSSIEDTSPRVMAEMLRLASSPSVTWSEEDLTGIWRHQRQQPLDDLFSDREWNEAVESLAIRSGRIEPVETLADLIAEPQPPLEMLDALKRSAKSHSRDQTSSLPPDVATVMYFTAIAAALVRLNQRITRSDDEVIRYGLQLILEREWLDEETAELFREARARLEGGKDKEN